MMAHHDDKIIIEYGTPVILQELRDRISDGLPGKAAKQLEVDFLTTSKIGQDLSLVGWKFLHWLQTQNLQHAIEQKMPEDVVSAIKQCVDAIAPLARGEPLDISAAQNATSVAFRASLGEAYVAGRWPSAKRRSFQYACRSAERAALGAAWNAGDAESIAKFSAESAENAAESAAWSAAARVDDETWGEGWVVDMKAWKAASAEGEAYRKMAAKLLELIKEAPFWERGR